MLLFSHSEESLCHQVLKGKYFLDGSFLEVGVGHNPSFIWRSLLAGRILCWRGLNGGSVMGQNSIFGRISGLINHHHASPLTVMHTTWNS